MKKICCLAWSAGVDQLRKGEVLFTKPQESWDEKEKLNALIYATLHVLYVVCSVKPTYTLQCYYGISLG